MNKLEQKFAEAFENRGGSPKEVRKINAEIAAKIALDLAERAWFKLVKTYDTDYAEAWDHFQDFKKEVLGDSSIN